MLTWIIHQIQHNHRQKNTYSFVCILTETLGACVYKISTCPMTAVSTKHKLIKEAILDAYHPFSPLLHTNLLAVSTKNSKRHIMIYPLVVSRINLVILQRHRVQVLIVKLSVKYRYLMNLHKHT